MLVKPPLGAYLNRGHWASRSLVGCWLMNEGGGSIVNDLSGNGNKGTLKNNTHWVSGLSGSALDFDGIEDGVTLASTIPARIGTTIARIKVDDEDNCTVCGIIDIASAYNILIYDSLDRFYVGSGDGSSQYWSYTDSTFLNWTQVAVVCNGTNAYPYINGQLLGAGKALPYLSGIEIIGDGHAYDFGGNIDYLYLYNRALSASEIASLYLYPFQMFEDDLSLLVGAAASPSVTNIDIYVYDTE